MRSLIPRGEPWPDQATQRLIAICLPRTELRGNWLPTLYPPVAASGKSCRSCGHALPSVPDPIRTFVRALSCIG